MTYSQGNISDHRISDLVENLQMHSEGLAICLELKIRWGYSQAPVLQSVKIDPSTSPFGMASLQVRVNIPT